jgi:TonB family protein
MKMMRKILPIILIFVVCGFVFGQELGKPINLPKPLAVWKTCKCKFGSSKQKVLVQIEIDETGSVIKAFAMSGHPLFRAASEQSARFSKFSKSFSEGKPQPTYSEIIYTFDINKDKITIKTPILRFTKNIIKVNDPIKLGIINAKATFLPKPIYPQAAKDFCAKGKVEVEVLVSENGNVIEAKAISGDELLRESAVEAAKKAKFRNAVDGKGFNTKGIIVYNFVVEKKCSKNVIINKKEPVSKSRTYSFCIVNGKAINLPKPEYPQIAKAIRAAGEVQIQVVIDKKGNVVEAKAVSGHPFLRSESIKAALKSTFEPVKLSGKPVKITGVIVYKFLL